LDKKQFVEQEIARSQYRHTAHVLRHLQQCEDAASFAQKRLDDLEQRPTSEPAFNEEFGGALRRFLIASREFVNRTKE
jgi:hypothetical protein